MSLERSPAQTNVQTSIPPPLAQGPIYIEPSVCQVCNETMGEGEDCLIIHECSHAFHRECIEAHLATSSECPVCKRACRLCELRRLVINYKAAGFKATVRSKARGAMARHYNTRSSSHNLFSDVNPPNPTGLNTSQTNVLETSKLDTNEISAADNWLNSPFRNALRNP